MLTNYRARLTQSQRRWPAADENNKKIASGGAQGYFDVSLFIKLNIHLKGKRWP
jgi:hypothetical protein